jgi:hypothetical protein
MQLALGSFIALWVSVDSSYAPKVIVHDVSDAVQIVYVIWATWKLSRRGQPASGDTGEHG